MTNLPKISLLIRLEGTCAFCFDIAGLTVHVTVVSVTLAFSIVPINLDTKLAELLKVSWPIGCKYNEAITIYDRIMVEYPNLIDVKFKAAKLHNILSNHTMCDSIFLELLDIDPNNINFLNDFSIIIANRENSNKEELIYAIGLIEYGLNLDNNNYELLDTYGWINYKLENYNLALEYVNKSLSIERDSIALEHLIEILKTTNKSNQIKEIQSNFFDSK